MSLVTWWYESIVDNGHQEGADLNHLSVAFFKRCGCRETARIYQHNSIVMWHRSAGSIGRLEMFKRIRLIGRAKQWIEREYSPCYWTNVLEPKPGQYPPTTTSCTLDCLQYRYLTHLAQVIPPVWSCRIHVYTSNITVWRSTWLESERSNFDVDSFVDPFPKTSPTPPLLCSNRKAIDKPFCFRQKIPHTLFATERIKCRGWYRWAITF